VGRLKAIEFGVVFASSGDAQKCVFLLDIGTGGAKV
jgi:hypothetical protein